MSKLEEQLAIQLRAVGLPTPEREYRFAAMATGGTGAGVRQRIRQAGMRDWRMDFCWPSLGLAVEVEGGGYINGRHNRGSGFAADLKKYSAAMRLGYIVYRCDGTMIKSGEAIDVIQALFERHRSMAA